MVAVAIVFIVFVFVLQIVRMSQKFELEKEQIKQGGRVESGVGLSELKSLIRESIEESMQPMSERLRVIERRLDRLPAPNEAKQPLLDVPDEEYGHEVSSSELRTKDQA